MAFYTKYKGNNFKVDVNQQSENFIDMSGDGRNTSITQNSTTRRVGTGCYDKSGNQIYAEIASAYTQKVTLVNGSYISSWSITRNTSPEESAATGSILSGTTSGNSTGVTVYSGDTLSASATAAGTTYGSYNFSSLSTPGVTINSNTQITITNPNTVACTVYMGTSSSSITTNKGTIAAKSGSTNGSLAITGLSGSTTYYFVLKATQTRPKYTHSTSLSWSTNTVSGDNTLTITGSETATGTENGSLISSGSNSGTTFASSYTLTITKNTGISTIYYKINGATSWSSTTSSTTKSVNYGSTIYYYAVGASGYDDYYDEWGTASASKSISDVKSNKTIAPRALQYWTLTMTANSGTSISASRLSSSTYGSSGSLSSGAKIYYNDVIIATGSLTYSYGSYTLTVSESGLPSNTTRSNRYQTTNSTRNGWTDSDWDGDGTSLVSGRLWTFTVVSGNITLTTTASETEYKYHGFSDVGVSNISKNGSATFSPFSNTGVSNLNYYPTTNIQVDGLVGYGNATSSFSGLQVSSLNYSASLKHASNTRSENRMQNISTVSSTAPTSIQFRVSAGNNGIYKTNGRVWGVRIQEKK